MTFAGRIQVAAALLAVVTATGAQAQITSEQQNAIRSSCRSDFTARCTGVTPGGREALECLQKNVGQLSGACQSAVKATMPEAPRPAAVQPAPQPPTAPGQAAPPTAPTAAPVTKTAPPASPASKSTKPAPTPTPKPAAAQPPPAAAPAVSGTPQPAPPAQASPQQQTGMPKAPAITAAVVLRACKLDLVRHCNGVPAGDGRILACLTAHEPDLTIRCRTALTVEKPLR